MQRCSGHERVRGGWKREKSHKNTDTSRVEKTGFMS